MYDFDYGSSEQANESAPRPAPGRRTRTLALPPRTEIASSDATPRSGGPIQRRKVDCPGDQVRAALTRATALVARAKQQLADEAGGTGARPATAWIGELFGDRTSYEDVCAVVGSLHQQLLALDDPARLHCYDGQPPGPDPCAGRPGVAAINSGAGADAEMCLCPAFFGQDGEGRAKTLIHEASHGLGTGATRDIAYAGERLFRFLAALNVGIANADSVASFVVSVGGGTGGTAVPPLDTVHTTAARAMPARVALGMVGLAGRATAKRLDRIAACLRGELADGSFEHADARLKLGWLVDNGLIQFGSVRIHQGESAAAIGAIAYARGDDVHFAPGSYDPGSAAGRALLGHELAHVVQQRAGRVATPAVDGGAPINDDAGLEREADEAGARAARGEPAGIAGGGESAGGDQPVQCMRYLYTALPDDATIHASGGRGYVMLGSPTCHISIYTKDQLEPAQRKRLIRMAKQDQAVKLTSLAAFNKLAFDELHVTINGQHHFYSDDGHIKTKPQFGDNEPFDSPSWRQANEIAAEFYQTRLGLYVNGTLDGELDALSPPATPAPVEGPQLPPLPAGVQKEVADVYATWGLKVPPEELTDELTDG